MDDARAALSQLRIEIDAIDDQIGALLALRFAKTDAVGVYKAMTGEAALDPLRQLHRIRLLHAIAERRQLPTELVLGIFGKIKDEVVSRHKAAGCVDGAQPRRR